MKKAIIMFFLCLTLVSVSSCGEKKILHCDKCNAEVEVAADSEMEESWEIRCSDCNK